MLLRLFIAALWSPAGKGLTSWLSFVMFYCTFVTSTCGILGQVLYLIVSIPDLCHISNCVTYDAGENTLLPMVSLYVPLTLLPLLQFSN